MLVLRTVKVIADQLDEKLIHLQGEPLSDYEEGVQDALLWVMEERPNISSLALD